MYRQFFSLGVAIALSACGQSGAREEAVPDGTIVFNKFIDFPIVDEFAKELGSHEYDTVRLSSPGGNPVAALSLLRTLEKYEVNIEVRGICMSACAEVALLAKNNVVFVENPIFGVHYNAYSTDFLLHKFGYEEIRNCYKKNILDKYANFISDADLEKKYKELSLQMVNRLDFYDSRNTYLTSKTSGCQSIEFASRSSYWFPNSRQLATYFGPKFHGSLAADVFQPSQPSLKFFVEAAGHNRYVLIGEHRVYLPK